MEVIASNGSSSFSAWTEGYDSAISCFIDIAKEWIRQLFGHLLH